MRNKKSKSDPLPTYAICHRVWAPSLSNTRFTTAPVVKDFICNENCAKPVPDLTYKLTHGCYNTFLNIKEKEHIVKDKSDNKNQHKTDTLLMTIFYMRLSLGQYKMINQIIMIFEICGITDIYKINLQITYCHWAIPVSTKKFFICPYAAFRNKFFLISVS